MIEVTKSPFGHSVLKKKDHLAIAFAESMLCYSTSQLNGGIGTINSCFNHKLTSWINSIDQLPGGSIRGYLEAVSYDLGFSPDMSTGLMTTASMENASLEWADDKYLNLFCIITAGAGVNAVRSGDPPSYYEHEPDSFTPIGGTINIILVIEANLPVDTLARTAIIATEAKTAALQEMNIKSCFSDEIATGTGTDGLIIACHDGTHSQTFTDCGNHSKLGFLISSIIKTGIKKSITKERESYEASKKNQNEPSDKEHNA